MVRTIASGHLRKDRELATSGPYARTRNPLYLGSAFLAIGFAIAGHSWWAGSLVIIYFAVFYYAVMRNEERDLRARFGSIFDEYAARVPLFLPNFFDAGYVPPADYHAGQNILLGSISPQPRIQSPNRHNRRPAIVWLRMWLHRRYGY